MDLWDRPNVRIATLWNLGSSSVGILFSSFLVSISNDDLGEADRFKFGLALPATSGERDLTLANEEDDEFILYLRFKFQQLQFNQKIKPQWSKSLQPGRREQAIHKEKTKKQSCVGPSATIDILPRHCACMKLLKLVKKKDPGESFAKRRNVGQAETKTNNFVCVKSDK